MREDAFLFLRGTFYRWVQHWPETCADLTQAPKVLACGDLHVGSFGTWRDSEGRLCWGVDDFDEAYPLPYTNDLVRLATSVKIVNDSKNLTISLKAGCDAILEGYQETLKQGGCPINFCVIFLDVVAKIFPVAALIFLGERVDYEWNFDFPPTRAQPHRTVLRRRWCTAA